MSLLSYSHALINYEDQLPKKEAGKEVTQTESEYDPSTLSEVIALREEVEDLKKMMSSIDSKLDVINKDLYA